MARRPITTMNVSLPPVMRRYVEGRMREGGFANASEYIRYVVRQDQEREARKRGLVELLEEGLAGGVKPFDRKLVGEIKTRARARAARVARNRRAG